MYSVQSRSTGEAGGPVDMAGSGALLLQLSRRQKDRCRRVAAETVGQKQRCAVLQEFNRHDE